MGNKTTVGTLGVWGVVTVILLNTLEYFQPDFYAAVIAGSEEMIALAAVAFLSWLSPNIGSIGRAAPSQSGFVDVRLLVVLAFSLVLMACGAGTVFKPKTDSCDSYKDPVYQGFCKADLIIEAARAEVNRQKALSTTDARAIELNGWEAKVKRADADLAHVEKMYRSTGVLLDAENAAVGVLVNQLEGWALK